jgi:hypothetical protein
MKKGSTAADLSLLLDMQEQPKFITSILDPSSGRHISHVRMLVRQ